MDIRCIALDLDRTTLNEKGRLSEENRQAILYAMEKGVHVVVASGRSFHSLPAEIRNFPGIEYAVTSNGAAIYHVPTEKRMHGYRLTPRAVDRILALEGKMSVVYEGFVCGEAFADAAYVADPLSFGASKKAVAYIQSTRKPVGDIRGFFRRHKEELDSIDIIVKDAGMKQVVWRSLSENVPDIYITSSVENLIEISHRECGKHSGVKYIMNHLGIGREQVAAFGDGDNDADMLTFAGCGIAVANASPACKNAADALTLSNEENGVAYGVYHILKI